jgi:hypothetical protein
MPPCTAPRQVHRRCWCRHARALGSDLRAHPHHREYRHGRCGVPDPQAAERNPPAPGIRQLGNRRAARLPAAALIEAVVPDAARSRSSDRSVLIRSGPRSDKRTGSRRSSACCDRRPVGTEGATAHPGGTQFLAASPGVESSTGRPTECCQRPRSSCLRSPSQRWPEPPSRRLGGGRSSSDAHPFSSPPLTSWDIATSDRQSCASRGSGIESGASRRCHPEPDRRTDCPHWPAYRGRHPQLQHWPLSFRRSDQP